MSKEYLFAGNETMWLKLAESDNDYAIFFIKNWIPFNAWFYSVYKLENDRKHIEELKIKNNPVKNKIIALLTSPTTEGNNFRSYLSALHEKLENTTIKANGERIFFSEIYFRENSKNSVDMNLSGVKYFVQYEKSNKLYKIVVEKSYNKEKLYFNTSIKDINHLKNELKTANKLDNGQQQFLIQCFNDASPCKKESLISQDKGNSLLIGTYYFIKDSDGIAQGLIEVLYSLRCTLFHGEIIPNAENLSIYEPAYHILRTLIKTLKTNN